MLHTILYLGLMNRCYVIGALKNGNIKMLITLLKTHQNTIAKYDQKVFGQHKNDIGQQK